MQAYANNCICKFPNVFYIVSFDDILSYSNTLEEHVTDVHQVLAYLCKYGLFCNHKKCEFYISFLSFFVFVISPKGVFIDFDQIERSTE